MQARTISKLERRPRFFVHRHTGRLYRDAHYPQRFLNAPALFREINRDEYDRAVRTVADYAKRLPGYQNLHAGQTVHVFGNGPSLKDFAAARPWAGKITIGVNAAGTCIRPLTYWISVDDLYPPGRRPLYAWVNRWLRTERGRTVAFLRQGALLERNAARRRTRDDADAGWQPDELFTHCATGPAKGLGQGLYWTKSSVHAAVDLARHFGARHVVLWGVDYHDRSHHYSDSAELSRDEKDQPGAPWNDWPRLVEGFEKLRQVCEAQGTELLNANPDSRLTALSFIEPREGYAL